LRLILVADLGGPTMFARIGMMRALSGVQPVTRYEQAGWRQKPSEGFANQDAAETWLQETIHEGVAFEYEVRSKPHRPAHRSPLAPSVLGVQLIAPSAPFAN
jgi:hypothetical protein